MSTENRETLQGVYGALGRGELDAAARYLHPDCDLRPALWVPGGRSEYRGRQGARELFELIVDTWETVAVEAMETIEAGPDRILAVERWHTRGRDGIELDTELNGVYAFRDGLISRLEGFRDRTDALDAAGLSEEGMAQENVTGLRQAYEALGPPRREDRHGAE